MHGQKNIKLRRSCENLLRIK